MPARTDPVLRAHLHDTLVALVSAILMTGALSIGQHREESGMEERVQLVQSRRMEGLSFPPISSLQPYVLLTKPATVFLLVFTGVVGFAVASQGTFPPRTFVPLLLALTLGCAGANALTCYLDRDIDAIMGRTRHRPIPSSRVSPRKALAFGWALVALAMGFSLWVSLLTLAISVAGILNNVVVYSLWTKRRTPLNIFAGSLAGGLPAIGGYAAYANALDTRCLLIGAIVMMWIPVHVWSIALRYRMDYVNAGVPMLPVVVRRERAVQLIALTSCLLVVLSLVPAALGLLGPAYLYSAAILGLALVSLSLWLVSSPTEAHAWVVFKASNLYLGFLFLALVIDSLS